MLACVAGRLVQCVYNVNDACALHDHGQLYNGAAVAAAAAAAAAVTLSAIHFLASAGCVVAAQAAGLAEQAKRMPWKGAH